MSDYIVIADVGDTLKKLLWEDMKNDPRIYPAIIDSEDDITLSSPQDTNDTGKLSLFLYKVTENAYMKNRERERNDSVGLKWVPLFLDLYYLITPRAEERRKDHILLGKTMQVFHDNGSIRGSALTGSLEGGDTELRVVLHSLSFDHMMQLWQSFSEKNFKLSICYQVTPVRIDSRLDMKSTPVVRKELDFPQKPY